MPINTETNHLQDCTNFWNSFPKYMRKRYKNDKDFVEYYIVCHTRGWSFLGNSPTKTQDHENYCNELRSILKEWKRS